MLRLILWLSVWSILVDPLHGLENNIYPSAAGVVSYKCQTGWTVI